MACSMSSLMSHRSLRYFCRSSSISGSVRQGCLRFFQYAFQASLSSLMGRCGAGSPVPFCFLVLRLLDRFVDACVPSFSLIVGSLLLQSHQSHLALLYSLQKINVGRGGSYNRRGHLKVV